MNAVEEEEIAVLGPDCDPPDSLLRDAPADPFRSELLLSTHTRTFSADFDTMELTSMEDGDKAPDNPDSDDDSFMDDPLNDPRDTNAGDMSESPSNFDFSINSADLERDIRNSAMQTVAFEYVYSNAYDIVYSICTWPRLLLSYCFNLFRFARKKDDDADTPVPPKEDNRVQNMSIAASQSAAIGVGAAVMAGQSAAAGGGASTMSAAVSSLSTPTMIGLAVAAAIAVAATTAGVTTGNSNGSENNAAPRPGGCNDNTGSLDVKQGIVQIAFSDGDHIGNIDTPSTSALLLENKEELETVFSQVYNNVTANSTNTANGLVDPCDVPYIPENGVQMMQVESSQEDNFTNTFWVSDVLCNGCSDTDPLFGTNTDPVRAVDDFVDQFTQAIQPILKTDDPTQDNVVPAHQAPLESPFDVLFVAFVDPTTGKVLPDQAHQLGPGDLIELLPNIDAVLNHNMNDREEDQREAPQVLTPSSTTAVAPAATAVKASNPTANAVINNSVQQDVAPNSPGVELAPNYPAAAVPTNAKTSEPNPTQALASDPTQQDQISISPVLAPSAVSSPSPSDANSLPSFVIVSPTKAATRPSSIVSPSVASGPMSSLIRNPTINTLPPAATSPSLSTANRDQGPSKDGQQQAPQATKQKSSLPPITVMKSPSPSFVRPAPPPDDGNNGNTQSIEGQPMMPSGDVSIPASSTMTSPPIQETTAMPAAALSEAPNIPVPVGGSETAESYSAVPSENTMAPTGDMLSPESCAGLQMFAAHSSPVACSNVNAGGYGGAFAIASKIGSYPTSIPATSSPTPKPTFEPTPPNPVTNSTTNRQPHK
ncbi:hypothetical protein SEMRO_290_G109410.1 [Seminavis robusta]|uniref:Uncharacterized protein n=1 Tax=Seminavis robusta TaxID=568900 RepID=A0A9N8DUI7_9STRA|nr:hypothetical protein SEMRO_290_G109410.1 [Seminavis robusta]|eukprot:Sro290_g109410.1 n/a (823) ;mRNA; r:72113-74694